MGIFSNRFWYKIIRTLSDNDAPASADCVCCGSHKSKVVDNSLVFSCSGEEVKISMFGFENFDIDKAKEVMDTLRDILDVDGIHWVDKSVENNDLDGTLFVILRTHITYHDKLYSVILGTGTYGFEDYKLELMSEVVNDGEPIGGLTVTDVISILKNGYNPEVWYG